MGEEGLKLIKVIVGSGNGDGVKEIPSPDSDLAANPVRGNRVIHQEADRSITLDVGEESVNLWVNFRHSDDIAGPGSYLYIFKRDDKHIWHGTLPAGEKIVDGKPFSPDDDHYLCLVSSMKSYLGDLFLAQPQDLRILSVIDELNQQYDNITDRFVKFLLKFKKS